MQKLKLTKKYDVYPECKDSGVEWLGMIPKSWNIVSSRQLFVTKKERVGSDSSDYKILSLTLQGVVPKVLDGSGKNPAEYDTYQTFQKDDLVFCLFDYDVTPRTIGYVEENGMMTGAYTRLIPKGSVYSKYFYYYFFALDLNKELLHLCTGLRSSLSKPVFWSMKSSLPSLVEQEKIADYLDQKTGLIDKIIEKKKKQIELLKEKRTAVINKAVTKGLNNHTERKDVNINLQESMPYNWNLYKLKHIFNFQSGDGFPDDLQGNIEGEVPFLKVSDINGEIVQIDSSNNYVDYKTIKLKSWHLIQPNSILTAKIGAALSKNHRKINIVPVCIDNNMMAMSPKSMLSPGYAYWLSLIINMSDFQNISSVPSLNMSFLKEFSVYLPLIPDQLQIAKFLEDKVMVYDLAINKVLDSIKYLQEFKSSLISNVVTGKVKI